MKSFGGLFDRLVSAANLWRGWREFRRGKRGRPSVRAFELDAEREVLRLQRELAGGGYRCGEYRLMALREPKRRLIAAASVRDRVVHHAIHRLLAPLFDPGLIETTYACLPGRGSHRAVLAFLAALRRYRYVLSLDMRHYFLSIDRRILLELMARRLREERLVGLLRTIAESGAGLYRHRGVPRFLGLEPGFPAAGCGLPIGNLTSQWWGNHYLSGFDHYLKRDLKLPHCQRYMDDTALFSDSRSQLVEARHAAREWLAAERRLRLKKPEAAPRSTRGRFTYLGYRVSRAGIRPAEAMLARMRQRMTELLLEGDVETIERSVASYRGVVRFGEPL